VFVWIDIFAMHQHPGQDMLTDLKFLKEVLADAERTLMVLDPTGMILTRIWCLFEAWHSTRRGASKLSILSYERDLPSMQKVRSL
jgi:hypothetical protein